MKLGMQVGLGPGHTVIWGPSTFSLKRGGGQSPQFLAHICCDQIAAWLKMLLGMEVGLGPGDFVLNGDPVTLPQKGGGAPKFSAHVYCGQTARLINIVVGMEVGLSPGDFVLDGDPAPPHKGGGAPFPIFGPFLLRPNGGMHQDATLYAGRPHPRDPVFDGDPAPSPKGGGAPNVRPMSIAAKRLHESGCHLVRR